MTRDAMSLKGNLDALRGWVEMREGAAIHRDRLLSQRRVQLQILEPEEFPEVVAPGGPLVRGGGRHRVPVTLRLAAEVLVHGSHREPVGSPVRPLLGAGEHAFEIVHVDAVGDKTRLPVMRRQLHAIHRRLHQTGAPRNRRPISPLPSTLAPVPSRRTRPLSRTTP